MKRFSAFLWLGLLATAPGLTAQDCLPSITLYNGITSNLVPTDTDNDGMTDALLTTIDAAGLVRLGYNPCNSDALEFRIRKAGTGTGAPTTTEVTFNCDELGTQLVEVWGGDSQGQWNYTETYVLVQDILGECSPNPSPISADCSDDKIPPTLLLLNGLAASLRPDDEGGASVTITPNNLAYHREDNCGGPVKLRIRKGGTGAGVPLGKSVTFNCDELGTQLVEVWAGDGFGNWTFGETYVLVQDDNQACGHAVAPGCTPDLSAPDVLVHNGLSVSIAPGPQGAVAVVRAKPFLRQRRDNCNGILSFRIGRDDGSTTPPTTTSLNFGCDELGFQSVVIWAGDEAGNWSRTSTYVLVQDNQLYCGNSPKAGADQAVPSWKMTRPAAAQRTGNRPAGLDVTLQPNPTSGHFALSGRLEQAGLARCELYNTLGQRVAVLVEQAQLPAGEFRLDLQTGDVPAGLYRCVLQVSGVTTTLTLVRE